MITFPNAKINLGLNIVEKRPDGYHNLETIFYPIPLEDILEIKADSNLASDFQLNISGMEVESNADKNLVVKAYKLLKAEFDLPPIQIFLHKTIPSGAGLGGGSADASFMLKLLNDYFELQLSSTRLEELATTLGADCPFFIQNKVTFAQGIGDLFSPVELSLKGYYLYLIKPDLFISTAMAFCNITPKYPEISLKDIANLPLEQWKTYMVNDFEEPIFRQLPQLKQLKDRMYDLGAIYAAMSGSGSTIYGLFKEPHQLENNWKEGKYLLEL